MEGRACSGATALPAVRRASPCCPPPMRAAARPCPPAPGFLRLWTDSDPYGSNYASIGPLLTAFRTEWNANMTVRAGRRRRSLGLLQCAGVVHPLPGCRGSMLDRGPGAVALRLVTQWHRAAPQNIPRTTAMMMSGLPMTSGELPRVAGSCRFLGQRHAGARAAACHGGSPQSCLSGTPQARGTWEATAWTSCATGRRPRMLASPPTTAATVSRAGDCRHQQA